MTKYLQKSFNSPANNKAYEDNYDRIFGKKCECPEDCCWHADHCECTCHEEDLDE